MTHRTDRVWLAHDVSRCEPSRKIGSCETCGRYLALIPPMGSVADFSLVISLVSPWCIRHLSAHMKPVEGADKAVKPWPTGVA